MIIEENKFEAVDSFINIFKELSKLAVELKYSIEINGFHGYFITFMKNKVIIILTETYSDVLARKCNLFNILCYLDAACVAKQKILVVAFGVSRVENNYHDVDEYVRLDYLLNFDKIIEATIL